MRRGYKPVCRQLAGGLFLSGELFLYLCLGTNDTAVPNVDSGSLMSYVALTVIHCTVIYVGPTVNMFLVVDLE